MHLRKAILENWGNWGPTCRKLFSCTPGQIPADNDYSISNVRTRKVHNKVTKRPRKTHFFERHAHTGCAPSGVYGDFAQPAVCSVFSGTQSCAAACAEVFCEAASGILVGSSIAASAAEGAACSAAHGVRVWYADVGTSGGHGFEKSRNSVPGCGKKKLGKTGWKNPCRLWLIASGARQLGDPTACRDPRKIGNQLWKSVYCPNVTGTGNQKTHVICIKRLWGHLYLCVTCHFPQFRVHAMTQVVCFVVWHVPFHNSESMKWLTLCVLNQMTQAVCFSVPRCDMSISNNPMKWLMLCVSVCDM